MLKVSWYSTEECENKGRALNELGENIAGHKPTKRNLSKLSIYFVSAFHDNLALTGGIVVRTTPVQSDHATMCWQRPKAFCPAQIMQFLPDTVKHFDLNANATDWMGGRHHCMAYVFSVSFYYEEDLSFECLSMYILSETGRIRKRSRGRRDVPGTFLSCRQGTGGKLPHACYVVGLEGFSNIDANCVFFFL